MDKGPEKIAKYLEKQNHKAEIIFYNEKESKQVFDKCKNTGLIVVSANVSTYKKAQKLIEHLKKLQKPIVYAGIYAALYPEKAIEKTDLVVTKNPKETILELANRLENFQRISDVNNLWFKVAKEKIMKNE